MRYRRSTTLSIAALLVGCSSSGGTRSGGDGTGSDTEEATPTWGEVCTADGDCATGLCLKNSYASFGFCSAECAEPGELCEADEDGAFGGVCVTMPEDFPEEPRTFCAPVCQDIFECQGKTDLWEECKRTTWRGNPVEGSSEDRLTCGAPSARSRARVAEDCNDWRDAVAGFEKQKTTCAAYCEYLVTCQEVPAAATYNKDCCAWGCLLQMTKGGEVQEVYEELKECYEQNHFGFQGTPKLCSQPIDVCGKNPEDPLPQ